MRRPLLLLALFSAFTLPALAPRTALAQVPLSDADRAAARDLFFEGVKLQNDGKFAEGLDRFSRAQRVYSVPTHLLHIAECQVALGQLVEGAESYRSLTRTPLAEGAPPAFKAAQQQGAAELGQVEPRIPMVKIEVVPANAPSLEVDIDGTPMNAALVGVLRPVNPGKHTITVSAQGYAKQEAQLVIKEREQKTVPITLAPGGGAAVYPPPPVPVPPPAGGPQSLQPLPPAYQQGAEPPRPAPYPQGPLPPKPDVPPEYQAAPARLQPSASLLLGVTGGVLFPGGDIAANTKLTDYAGTGGALGLDAGIRFATHWILDLGFQHGFLGQGTNNLSFNLSGLSSVNTTSASTNLFEGRFAYVSNPQGFGFYGEVGLGYRSLSFSQTQGAASVDSTVKGAELSLGVGAYIKAGSSVRLIPKVTIGLGSFQSSTTSCTPTCPASGTVDIGSSNTGGHSFVMLGMSGLYNLDFGKN